MSRLVFLLLPLLLSSCTNPDSGSGNWLERAMSPNSKNLPIPRIIQAEIDKQYIKKFRETEKADVLTDEDILDKRTKAYLDLEVFVKAQSVGTLLRDTHFQSTRGGGKIRLRDLVKQKRGSFYLTFKVHDSDAKSQLKDYNLYFWSTASPRRIKDEVYGSDCGTLVKLDPAAFSGKGFRVNATEERYIPVIEGIYYFAHFKGPLLSLAVLQVGDDLKNADCVKNLAFQ